ncbi:MAG: SRPBCC family protein [Flavobacteriales bacterium]
MKYGKIVLYGIGGLFLFFIAFVGVAALYLPSTYEVERSILIEQPPEKVYKKVARLKEWSKWNPWSRNVDSNIYKGKAMGKGAIWKWQDSEQGEGELRIAKADPYHRIETRLYNADTTEMGHGKWSFERKGKRTRVTWKKSGDLAYPFQRVMIWLVGPEKMIGEDLEKGLENLKKHLEKGVRLSAERFSLQGHSRKRSSFP